MKSAILFIIFNRIETTKQSFEVIRNAKPPRLYIAADGPRESKTGESKICDEVRRISTNVDWDCEVKTLFQVKNLGCKKGVIKGINWFFENEDEGIIIEDDVIPKNEFFGFCDTMLNKYRDQDIIKVVLGFNQFGQEVSNNSYFFSRGFYAWGWATWKSRWSHYEENIADLTKLDDKNLKKIYPNAMLQGIKFNLDLVRLGLLDTWDYQMIYMIIIQKGYTIVPFANLTTNIGADGAHSNNNNKIFFKYGSMFLNELEHPNTIEDNIEMNKKLWDEYKQASLGVTIKTILFKLHVYNIAKYIYKKLINK